MKWTCAYKEGFYIFSKDGKEIYDFPNTKCNTEQKVNEWIAHLAEKNWWTQELEDEFIRLWKKQNGQSSG